MWGKLIQMISGKKEKDNIIDEKQAQEVFEKFKEKDANFRESFDKILDELGSGKEIDPNSTNQKLEELVNLVYDYKSDYYMNMNLLDILKEHKYGNSHEKGIVNRIKHKVTQFQNTVNFQHIIDKAGQENLIFKYKAGNTLNEELAKFVTKLKNDQVTKNNINKKEKKEKENNAKIFTERNENFDKMTDLFDQMQALSKENTNFLPDINFLGKPNEQSVELLMQRFNTFDELYTASREFAYAAKKHSHIIHLNNIKDAMSKTIIWDEKTKKPLKNEKGEIMCKIGNETISVPTNAEGLETLNTKYREYQKELMLQLQKENEEKLKSHMIKSQEPSKEVKGKIKKTEERINQKDNQEQPEIKEESAEEPVNEQSSEQILETSDEIKDETIEQIPAICAFTNITDPDELLDAIKKSGEEKNLSGTILTEYISNIINEPYMSFEEALKVANVNQEQADVSSEIEVESEEVYEPDEIEESDYSKDQDDTLIEPDNTDVYKSVEIETDFEKDMSGLDILTHPELNGKFRGEYIDTQTETKGRSR